MYLTWSKIIPLVLFLAQCFTSAWEMHHLVLAFGSWQTFLKYNIPTLQPCFHCSNYDLTAYASSTCPKAQSAWVPSVLLVCHFNPEQWHPEQSSCSNIGYLSNDLQQQTANLIWRPPNSWFAERSEVQLPASLPHAMLICLPTPDHI